MRAGELARPHHLQAGVEPADAGRETLAARILQRDDAPPGLLGADQIERLQHQRAHLPDSFGSHGSIELATVRAELSSWSRS